MSYSELNPHTGLSTFIDAYWMYVDKKPGQLGNKILPDGCVDLIINLGSDVLTNCGETLRNEKIYLTGPMTAPMETVRTNDTFSIGIRFKPSAFNSFFNLGSLHVYQNKTIEFEKARSIDFKKLLANPSMYLNDFMFERLKSKTYNLWPVVNEIQKAAGQITLPALSSKTNLTIRQMERRFKEDVGFSPKSLSKLYRFRKALEEIKRGTSLTEIAFKCGYYDQAHLCNEFKKYTGSVPTSF